MKSDLQVSHDLRHTARRLRGMIAALGLGLCIALPAQAEGPSSVGSSARGGGGGGGSESSGRVSRPSSNPSIVTTSPRDRSGDRDDRRTDDRRPYRRPSDRYPNEGYNRGEYSRPDERGRDAWPRGIRPHPYMHSWRERHPERRDINRRHDHTSDGYIRDRARHYYYSYNDRYYDGYYPVFVPLYADSIDATYYAAQPVAEYEIVDRRAETGLSESALRDQAAREGSAPAEEQGYYEEVPTREVIDGQFVDIHYPAVFREGADGKLVQLEEERTVREPKIRIILKRQWVGPGEPPSGSSGSQAPEAGVQIPQP